MGQFIKVANVSDVPEHQPQCVHAEGHAICLVNLGGDIKAVADTCSHADASLSDGEVDGDEIICPLHYASFCLNTGEARQPPADEDIRVYNVRVTNGDIEVEI